MLKRQQKIYIYKNRNEICERIFLVLKTGASVCLRPNPLPETTRAVTLHGEGSFGFPAVTEITETTGRQLPTEASPSGGAGDKNKEKVQSGSRWAWCKTLPVAGSMAETGMENRQLPPKSSCHAGQARLAKEGAMARWATQRPPEPLRCHSTPRVTAAFCVGVCACTGLDGLVCVEL